MKVVVAMDSFKGSLSSIEAGKAIRSGIYRVDSNTQVVIQPLADGGEGTVNALVHGMGGIIQSIQVKGPTGKKVKCDYGIIEQTKTALIEIAEAAGITLVAKEDRNPLNTTTYGVGEVIKDAIGKGCRRFMIGIGGSATNDGGIGMLQALGYQFINEKGEEAPFGAKGLEDIRVIDDSERLTELEQCEFRIACDVVNPLCGREGCSAVYGGQKGADSAMIVKMDNWLNKYAKLVEQKYKHVNPNFAGAGAAGGLGFAFQAFLHGKLERGIDIILEEIGLEGQIKDASLVITGEGKLDSQSVMGKAPIGVAALAKKYHKPVIAFAGSVMPDAKVCNNYGIDAYFPILRHIETLEEAMRAEHAIRNMEDTAEQAFRLFCLKE